MKSLLAAILAATAPATSPPAVATLIEKEVVCFVDPHSITYVVVCVDRNGKKSWIA